jgi:UPF0716 protein FxsA
VGKWLLLLFTLVPLVETFLLYVMGRTIGFWWSIAFMIATALAGTFFGKREGLKVWREWKESLARGRMPEEGIIGGVLVLIGAALLITPGVLTDVTGLALMIPVSRKFIGKHVRRYLEKRFATPGGGFSYRVHVNGQTVRSSDGVIDTDGEVLEERRPNDEPRVEIPANATESVAGAAPVEEAEQEAQPAEEEPFPPITSALRR